MKADIIHIEKCPTCSGHGMTLGKEMKDARVYDILIVCPKCKGKKMIVTKVIKGKKS